jgi:hypothetical protein
MLYLFVVRVAAKLKWINYRLSQFEAFLVC